tara:strand:- start:571 stop:927 length:357 start_codon:yes stop_codon:yes gene_type:complete
MTNKLKSKWEILSSGVTNFVPFPEERRNTKIFIGVSDVDLDVDEVDEDEKKEIEEEIIGQVFEFDLEHDLEFFNLREFESPDQFVHNTINEQLSDRISDHFDCCVNSANWVEVEKEQN